MALSTAEQLRRRLQDVFRFTAQYVLGDGTATAFPLSGFPIASGAGSATAFAIGAGGAQAATAAAFKYAEGWVAFPTALSAGSAVLVSYYWSVLSTEELDTITAMQGSLDAQTLEGLRWIVLDMAKRQKWAMSQGPSVDPASAQRALLDLLKYYEGRVEVAGVSEGGIESWAEWIQTQ